MLFKKIFKDEKGGVILMAAAIIVSLVAFISSGTLMNLVSTDQLQTQYEQDKIQEEMLLRSEATRSHLAIEHNDHAPLPNRTVEINGPDRITSYYIENRKRRVIISNFMGYATEQAIAVQSLIEAKRGRKYAKAFESPIKRMTERLIKNKSLAEYQYFTETEASENADGGDEAARVNFYGADELFGPVHSNDNIWIQNVGGWPTFYDMVTTTKRIMDDATGQPAVNSAPMDQIFQGGYEEEVPEIIFEPDADDLRQNGTPLGEADTDIVYVKLDAGGYASMYGTIVDIGTQEFDVYSWYPKDRDEAEAVIAAGGNWFEDADNVWTNHISLTDTVWSNGPSGSVNNQSFWCESAELWIEGEVSGKTTFGSADTVFIVGDITYNGTLTGNFPDGFSGFDPVTGEPEYNGPVNADDYFGLVSEEKILIRYKHRDPYDYEQLVDENCNDVTIYGAYAAIGAGDQQLYPEMYCHYDGIFTFQYHHPHGSTPNFDAPSPYISEEFTISLFDSAGDGWDDASLDVIVDGELVLEGITCYTGELTEAFMVDNGDVIETAYTPGGNENEHSYEIYDHNGDVVASDGPSPGAGVAYQALLPAGEDSTYTYVDLHKYVFPKSDYLPPGVDGFNLHGAAPPVPCGFPYEDPGYILSYPNNDPDNYVYPYGTDYPWYNPVWPESTDDIVFERGYLNIFGAIAQRRRGFVHRSGSDPYNHPEGFAAPSPWEMNVYHYDGNHPSTGYDKNYHYDRRFLFIQPPNYPQIYQGWGEDKLTTFTEESWFFKSPDEW